MPSFTFRPTEVLELGPSPGGRLGPYEIVAPVGAGGMGEVYRATDTRLGRDVALKLLPEAFASDPERLARFEREAKLLASLNHPGIAHLYGFESATVEGGAKAHVLAMEFVAGEDLAERLKRGPIPVDEAIAIARQVAEALEEAHEKGIVHRDLKPANLKATAEGKVKVLDFGLAKAWTDEGAGAASSADFSQSPTLASTGSAAGLILGTAAYMSPEQARGKAVDRRTDIWAFGVVLFEMLAGRKLFDGETVTDVLASVVRDPIDWSALPASTPPAVRALLERCLERDPRQRLRDIGEARIALERGSVGERFAAGRSAPTAQRRILGALPWLLVVALAAIVAWPRGGERQGRGADSAIRFAFEARDAQWPLAQLSPDARYVAFNQEAARENTSQDAVFVRPLASFEAAAVPQTERAGAFFWSPDGRQLAVANARRLAAYDVAAGSWRPIADLTDEAVRGGSWSRDGTILLSVGGALRRVSAAGGALETVLAPEKGRYSWHAAPIFLPDGRRFLFTSETGEGGENVLAILAGDLASPASPRVLRKRAIAVGLVDDRLFFVTTEGQMEAVRVNPSTLEPAGETQVLARAVRVDSRIGLAAASVAADGSVAYRLGSEPVSGFVWMDRSGRRIGRLGEPGPWHNFDLSLDGRRVIAATRRRGTSTGLFLLDAARGITSPVLDPGTGTPSDPTFSPDGTRIAYRLRSTLVTRPVQGGEETVLVNEAAYPDSWSRDGKWLAYGAPRLGHFDLFATAVDAPERPPILLATGSPQSDEPRFSPNGRWVAYHAGASEPQVFVIPFPPTGERWQVSSDGGVQPRWSPDGDELFYLDPAGRVTSVSLPGSDPRRAAAPRALFETNVEPSSSFDQLAVASRDRFLLRLPLGSDPGVPVHVILGQERGGGDRAATP
jgi:Tol biopolymer transport system component/tRNA A-37 threonylcarbamoyl transferase component Bud32